MRKRKLNIKVYHLMVLVFLVAILYFGLETYRKYKRFEAMALSFRSLLKSDDEAIIQQTKLLEMEQKILDRMRALRAQRASESAGSQGSGSGGPYYGSEKSVRDAEVSVEASRGWLEDSKQDRQFDLDQYKKYRRAMRRPWLNITKEKNRL